MMVMSCVICGRVPVGIIRSYSTEDDSKTLENISDEYLFDPESDAADTGVITDVQIDELRSTQEKVIKLSSLSLKISNLLDKPVSS